jgi:hypothetical protein
VPVRRGALGYIDAMPAGTASRDSWKNQPLPEARAPIPYARAFDRDESARAKRGLVPQQREDKWFIYHEDSWLFFHRSWTGICVYAVRLRADGEGSAVEGAWVNRDPEQYRATDDAHDVALLSFLVEALLLGRAVPFPVRESFDKQKAPLLKLHTVGSARSNDEE